MIERRAFDVLPGEDLGWLKARHHFSSSPTGNSSRDGWRCLRVWNDEEIAPHSGFEMQFHSDIEIVIYVREGVVTHRDNLGNEGRIGPGDIQVISAGAGIRHAEYNLESISARIFQLWIAPSSTGGAPGWAMQPCHPTQRSGCFVPIASGSEVDRDSLPIRARARLLSARVKVGESIDYGLRDSQLAYLVSSVGSVAVNGIHIHARDGAEIQGVDVVTITAVEDAEVVMLVV